MESLTIDKRSERVVDVDSQHLPIGLSALGISLYSSTLCRTTHIVDSKRSKNLDLLHLSNVSKTAVRPVLLHAPQNSILSNIEQIHRVVVSWLAGELVFEIRAFPRLRDRAIQERVSLQGEHTLDESGFSLPIIVKDRVYHQPGSTFVFLSGRIDKLTKRFLSLDLNLCVFPSWNFNNKVDHSLVGFVGVERHIVPERDGLTVFLQPDSPVLLLAVRTCRSPHRLTTYQGIFGTNSSETVWAGGGGTVFPLRDTGTQC